MTTHDPTMVVLGREMPQYDGPADGEMSAKAEIGLRAAASGDHALALAQIFALPPEMRGEYKAMLAAILVSGRKPGVRLHPQFEPWAQKDAA